MNQKEKAQTFGSEVRRRMPELTESQAKALAHAFTASQHGYPSTGQGIASADRTFYNVILSWRKQEAV